MVMCAIAGCSSNNKYIFNKRYFRFPSRSKARRENWIKICCRRDNFNVDHARICSDHFREEDFHTKRYEFLKVPLKKRCLNSKAVPSLNLPKSYITKLDNSDKNLQLKVDKKSKISNKFSATNWFKEQDVKEAEYNTSKGDTGIVDTDSDAVESSEQSQSDFEFNACSWDDPDFYFSAQNETEFEGSLLKSKNVSGNISSDPNSILSNNKVKVEVETEDLEEIQLTGRRIVNIDAFWKAIKVIDGHNLNCRLSDLILVAENKRGFSSDLKFKCLSCYKMFSISTCESMKSVKLNANLGINAAAVFGTISGGCKHSQLEELMSMMEIPCLCQNMYTKLQSKIGNIQNNIFKQTKYNTVEKLKLEKELYSEEEDEFIDETKDVIKKTSVKQSRRRSSMDSATRFDYLKKFNARNRCRTSPLVVLSSILEQILNELRDMYDAQPFLFPIKSREVPDYYRIIKKPMDLQTIRENLRQMKYKKSEEFLSDINQIVDNSMLYNGSNNAITHAAKKMLQRCIDRLAENGEQLMKTEKAFNSPVEQVDIEESKRSENTKRKRRGRPPKVNQNQKKIKDKKSIRRPGRPRKYMINSNVSSTRCEELQIYPDDDKFKDTVSVNKTADMTIDLSKPIKQEYIDNSSDILSIGNGRDECEEDTEAVVKFSDGSTFYIRPKEDTDPYYHALNLNQHVKLEQTAHFPEHIKITKLLLTPKTNDLKLEIFKEEPAEYIIDH